MASSSKSSIHENFKYHVFLSFRGEDTRTTFVDHLYASLKRLGIHTFRDNEELEKGRRIDELFKAIQESKFFIIVFSCNYASSSWCLMELSKIMECQDGNKRMAFPLFYDVDPSHIRNQIGPVGKAIAKHVTNKRFKKWETALEDAGNLVGWDIKKIANGHEAEAIDQIVKTISLKLRSVHLRKDENIVGMESRMKNLESFLGKDLDDEVRMIGIKGMGGIGKTTLARAIFQKISSEFEGASFVDDVREASKERGGLLSLQKQVLKDVLRDDSVSSVQDAISMMEDRMPMKKVLLVLDNVDHIDQLEALAGALDWFKGGSRIIVTARDKQVLTTHGMNIIIDINLLSDEEALSLFCRYAFKTYIPVEGYGDLSFKVVEYAAGLPLTLKVLGSSLFGKKEPYWIDAIKRLETIPCGETLDKLKISYDGLENDQKEIFQDVACFMNGMPKNDAIRMLESRGFYAIAGLTVLEDRSLITIPNGKLSMHDSLQELGRIIVRGSPPSEPINHSRLWIRKEVEALLCDDEVTEATATCISVWSINLDSEIIMKGLGKLKNLTYLQISGRDSFSHPDNWMCDEGSFPNSLRFLKWAYYPCRSLPQTFRANNLVGLELPFSKITKLWESEEGKVLSNLRFLNISSSKLRTLDLGMTPNLESLNLKACYDLKEIHAPTKCLKRLVYLNLCFCWKFESSSFIKKLESLELLSLPKLKVKVESYLMHNRLTCYYFEESLGKSQKSISLNLQDGKKIESLSRSFIGLQHKRHFTLDGPIPELPDDLDQLANLEELNLVHCFIKCLPDSICKFKHLKYLKLKNCWYLKELPRDLGQLVCLETLCLRSIDIKCLPESICMLKHLKFLQLIICIYLEELPRDLGQLECLERLILIRCGSLKVLPNSICNMKRLKELKILSTGISRLPQCISLLEGLRIVGSMEVLQSCDSATMIRYSHGGDPFCYIKALDNTQAKTQFT